MNKIKVSVIVISYNHDKFIDQCLDSILNQKCDFNFEIIIGDDASSDLTQSLIIKKQKDFPDILFAHLNKSNLGMNYNLANMIHLAKGEFIAFCEGDDFWHNPDKLQKHYNFLKNSQIHSMVYSDYGRLQTIGNKNHWIQHTINTNIENGNSPRTYDLLKDIHIHISAIMAKTDLVIDYLKSDFFNPKLKLGDVPMFLYLSTQGKIEYLKFSASTYRLNPASITNSSKASRLSVVHDHVAVSRLRWVELTKSEISEIKSLNKERLFNASIYALSWRMAKQNVNWYSLKQIIKLCMLLIVPNYLEKKLDNLQKKQNRLFINETLNL
jgi:glycosyltransferase involved in cell wall biosynthesis